MIWLWIFGIYWSISLILYFFPKLLHRQPHNYRQNNRRSRPKVVAHRGGSQEGLENTIPAFRAALDAGADALEMDVFLTKDGVPVVFHDENLKRMAGVPDFITEVNYSDLPRLKERTLLHYTKDSYYEAKSSDNMTIPKLEDVFKAFPGKELYIEVKSSTPQAIELIGNMIRSYKRERITTWNGCSHWGMIEMKRRFPEIATWNSFRNIGLIAVLFYFGMLPFLPILGDIISESLYTEGFYYILDLDDDGSFKAKFNRFIEGSVTRLINFMDNLIFFHLKRRGIECGYWVCIHEHEFERAIQGGVDAITTDRPSACVAYLNSLEIESKKSK